MNSEFFDINERLYNAVEYVKMAGYESELEEITDSKWRLTPYI